MKKAYRILTMVLALCLALSVCAFASGEPSGEASGEASKSVEDAYVDYIREFLANELQYNSLMSADQIENDYIPLIRAGAYDEMPAVLLYTDQMVTGNAMTFEEFAAQYGGSGEAKTTEEAYVDYLHDFLLAELGVNEFITLEQIENEYMPLIQAGDFNTWPASLLFNGMLVNGVAMGFDDFAAQYSAGGDVTWQDFQDWLISILPEISPFPDEVGEIIRAAQSWEDMADASSGPWGKIFGEDAFNCTTWDEFVANGGVGTYNANFIDLPL